MATARVCRATLSAGRTLQCTAWPIHHTRPLVQRPLCIRFFNNTTPSIHGDNLPPDPPVQTPQPSLTHQKPSGSESGQSGPSPWQDETSLPRPTRQQTHPRPQQPSATQQHLTASSARYDPDRAPTAPVNPPTSPLQLTPTIREYLPHLASQPPFYITIHIHGKPYLVTNGDTVRLPFLMHGVKPGDVLRLDRATAVGSRDWTLLAGSPTSSGPAQPTASALGPQDVKSRAGEGAHEATFTSAEPIIGKTSDLSAPPNNMHQMDTSTSQLRQHRPKRRNKPSYLDPRLFLCRATVLGTESEPLRIMEKTKQRQRKVKHVKSKMRYTILKIQEIQVKSLAQLDELVQGDQRHAKLVKEIFRR